VTATGEVLVNWKDAKATTIFRKTKKELYLSLWEGYGANPLLRYFFNM